MSAIASTESQPKLPERKLEIITDDKQMLPLQLVVLLDFHHGQTALIHVGERLDECQLLISHNSLSNQELASPCLEGKLELPGKPIDHLKTDVVPCSGIPVLGITQTEDKEHRKTY